jgi:hypothetical protein
MLVFNPTASRGLSSLLRQSLGSLTAATSAAALIPSRLTPSATSRSFHYAMPSPSALSRSSPLSTSSRSQRSFSAVPPPHPSSVPPLAVLRASSSNLVELNKLTPTLFLHGPLLPSRSPLTEEQYGRLADVTMDKLHDSLEELVEGEDGAEEGWEVEYSVSSLPRLLSLSVFVSGDCSRKEVLRKCSSPLHRDSEAAGGSWREGRKSVATPSIEIGRDSTVKLTLSPRLLRLLYSGRAAGRLVLSVTTRLASDQSDPRPKRPSR